MCSDLPKLMVLFLVFMVACQPTVSKSPTLMPKPTEYTTSIKTPNPISTKPPNPTHTATPLAKGDCLPVDAQRSNTTFSEYLLVKSRMGDGFMIDMKSFEKISVPHEEIAGDIKISPNGKWIANGTNYGEKIGTLTLAQPDGKVITSIPYDWKSQRFHWLNNEELLVYNNLSNGYRVPTFTLNTLTGEKKKISRNYPFIDWQASDWNSWAYAFDHEIFRYDPTLKFVIYHLDKSAGENGFAVTDVNTHQIVAHLLFPDMTSLPVWSPDGKSFVFANRNPGDLDWDKGFISNVFLGYPDGQIITLVKMSDYFASDIILAHSFQWSPDGRYILFSIQVHSPGWMIVDVQGKEVITLCTKGTSGSGFVTWSPDSEYVAIASGVDTPMFLVDLKAKKATQLDNLIPIGWLAK